MDKTEMGLGKILPFLHKLKPTHRAGAWAVLEMERPHGEPQNNYGLAQSKETSSLFGCVLGLEEVEKGCTETLDPCASCALTGQTAVDRFLS